MEQGVWLAFGGATMLLTWVSLASDTLPMRVSQMGAMLSSMLWGYWSISATNVTQTSRCCVSTTSYEGAAIFGAMLGVITLVFMLDSVWNLVGVTER
jgi:hypothetical protein